MMTSPERLRIALTGGLTVASSNSVHSSCRPKNLVAMIQATHEFGRYPLEL